MKTEKKNKKETFLVWFLKTTLMLVFIIALLNASYKTGINNGKYLFCQENNKTLAYTIESKPICLTDLQVIEYAQAQNKSITDDWLLNNTNTVFTE